MVTNQSQQLKLDNIARNIRALESLSTNVSFEIGELRDKLERAQIAQQNYERRIEDLKNQWDRIARGGE